MPDPITAITAGSAVLGFAGSKKAAKAQKNAAQQASNTEQQMFEQNRQDMAPWREAGVQGLDALKFGLGLSGDPSSSGYGDLLRNFSMSDFQQDPGYQFRQQQGEQAINRNALARGRYNSGGTLKELQRYNSGLASDEYGNAFNRYQTQQGNRYNRLAGISSVGQTSTQQVNADRSAVGNNVAQNQLAAGNASAAGTIGGINAISSAVGTGLNFYQNQQLLNQLRPKIPSAPKVWV